ncbi:MAG: hypothetical protein AABX53_03180 [Nanoarchaeota archaeon]
MNPLLKRALIDSVGTAAYIALIVTFIFSLQVFQGSKETILIPMAMLLLFVCSAAITGFLVFGKPAMLYVDGKKKEAISLLGHTIGMLVLITLVFFISLLVYASFFG